MGLFDIFGGGTGPEKANRLKPKLMQKYGDAVTRQKAIAQLGQMKIPEAAAVLLSRFTIAVEPGTTDADEKDHAFELIKDMGETAIAPIKDFLIRSDTATSWGLRLLSSLLSELEVIGICVDMLQKLGAEYTRDPEKKTVLIQFLSEKDDPRIAPVLVPFLEDMSDDVKLAAIRALGPRKHEPAREPLLALLTGPETARRVQTTVVAAVHESGFGVQGYREKVEALLTEPFYVDKSGIVKKRG